MYLMAKQHYKELAVANIPTRSLCCQGVGQPLVSWVSKCKVKYSSLGYLISVGILSGVCMWEQSVETERKGDTHSERVQGCCWRIGSGGCDGVRVRQEHTEPNYLGKQAQAQNQTLCHWGRSIEGGLRSVFGASSSSGQGGSGGLQGKEKQTGDHSYSPCPSRLKLIAVLGKSWASW